MKKESFQANFKTREIDMGASVIKKSKSRKGLS